MSDVTEAREARGCTSIFTWKGLLGDMPRLSRTVAYVMLLLGVGSLVFTQLGFVRIGPIHLFLVLVPIATGALMYGPIAGAIVGLAAGGASMAHALFIPFDTYEKFFAAPINSVILFTITGYVLGLLFALANRIGQKDRGRALALTIVACFIGSWFCSTFFHLNSYLITTSLSGADGVQFLSLIFDIPSIGVQLLLDALLMVAAVIAVAIGDVKRRETLTREPSLRDTFMGWLIAFMVLAFMFSAAFSYTVVTLSLISEANSVLDNHINYLASQLEERDRWITHVEENGGLTHEQHDSMVAESMESLATNLKLKETGITVIAEDGIIRSSNDAAFAGRNFEDALGEGLQGGFDPSIYNSRIPREYYLNGSADLAYLRAAQISYLRVEKVGSYQIAAILPAEEVFASRTLAIALICFVFLLIFGLVSVLASRLLDVVVVRGIDQTNQTLARITKGDLSQTVDVHDSREFTSLSSGINSTVGALKESIAEAETRLDRELATAKAIQASALPSTFPPFPQIDKFDIYASMEPAKEVGGDFYDFFLLENSDKVGIVLADVSGKGIPAALFMMSAKTEIANYMLSGMPLSDAIQTANYRLCQGNDAEMFVTVFAATIDYKTGVMEYVNAGHNPPLLRKGKSWEWLRDKSGVFLGAFDSATYRTHKVQLDPKDLLFIYTDGVTEAMNKKQELYSELRLEGFLTNHTDLGPRRLIESVRRDIRVFADGADQADDITMLCFEYGVAPRVTSSQLFPARVDQLTLAQDFIHAELARRACPLNVQNKIDICFEELFVNVAHYAYPDATEDNPGKVRVTFTYNPHPQGMTIQIIDEGRPFNPLAKDDPEAPSSVEEAKVGGLGIFMAKNLADDISYAYRDNCNIISFTKNW